MEILWPLGEASVRQVWERISTQRPVAYTTVMTVLCKMHRKGMLSQRKMGKAYYYTPAIDRGQALQSVVQHLLQAYFNGSPEQLLSIIAKEDPLRELSSHEAAPGEPSAAEPIDEVLL